MSKAGSTSSGRPNSQRVFVPSPRWLTESPARPPSEGAGSYGYRGPHGLTQPPWPSPHDQLRSPVPPVPANLYSGTATGALNVDPGVPFLATAGSARSDRDEPERGDDSPKQRRFVGGFVTGVRKLRRSLRESGSRDSQNEPPFPSYPNEFRDSGYSSTPQIPTPPLAPPRPAPQYTHASQSRPVLPVPPGRAYAEGEPDANTLMQEGVVSPPSVETVSLGYGSDYAMMDPPPPKSNISINSYLRRIQDIIHHVSSLPWVANDRVTSDYYPEITRRDDPEHLPAMEWHSHNYGRADYHLSFGPDETKSETASTAVSSSDSGVKAPHRMSSGAVDLDEEFNATPGSALQQPLSYTPRYDHLMGLSMGGPPGLSSNSPRQPPMDAPPPSSAPWAQWPEVEPTAAPQDPPMAMWQPNNTLPPGAFGTPIPTQTPRFDNNNPPPSDWEEYPRYMDGYVAPQYAERHYGAQYGPGIHSARPGVSPEIPATPSAASTRRQRLSYANPMTPRT